MRGSLAWPGMLKTIFSRLFDLVDNNGDGSWYVFSWVEERNYNVTSAYHFLFTLDNNLEADNTNLIWNKEVPLKVGLFAWRLLCNHIPTIDNLIWRRVRQPNVQLCVGGCEQVEGMNHLLQESVCLHNSLR